MPHNNLSDALLSLSEVKIETSSDKETLRECLHRLASIADTEYAPLSTEQEASGLGLGIQEMLDGLRRD